MRLDPRTRMPPLIGSATSAANRILYGSGDPIRQKPDIQAVLSSPIASTEGSVRHPLPRPYRASHIRIDRVTKSAASCCTKCPAPGTVTSVKSLSSHSHVLFNAGASSAQSFNP